MQSFTIGRMYRSVRRIQVSGLSVKEIRTVQNVPRAYETFEMNLGRPELLRIRRYYRKFLRFRRRQFRLTKRGSEECPRQKFFDPFKETRATQSKQPRIFRSNLIGSSKRQCTFLEKTLGGCTFCQRSLVSGDNHLTKFYTFLQNVKTPINILCVLKEALLFDE